MRRLRTPAVLVATLLTPLLAAQKVTPRETDGTSSANPGKTPDLAKVKQEEALRDLQRVEETMEKLARLLLRQEPHNAAKLDEAFLVARRQQVRENMKRIVQLIVAEKYDRAREIQKQVEKERQPERGRDAIWQGHPCYSGRLRFPPQRLRSAGMRRRRRGR